MSLGSALLIAAVPNFAKLAYDSGASVLFVLIGRFLISALLLGAALQFRGSFPISRRALRLCALGGLTTALMSFGFLSAITSIDISLAILIEWMVRSETRMQEESGYFDDGVFGYDFSEGYTSLEANTAKVRPYRESAIKRWQP